VNLKCEIDTSSLNKFISDLEGLSLSIAALDGDILDDINASVVQSQPKINFKKPTFAAEKYKQ